uniref:TIGR02687 family protein n=1 Tax=uncultured Thiotrichaceae bacterium TaxID=298394 RepID=A0A6S6T662_9GAMM|nr:MAG: TIGR02687 family protein [uncultured Thiotrichaceae bacterium]
MNKRIAQALQRQFDKHRIVFWYDAKKELRSDFETLQLEGVEKCEINHNEFMLKYRLLREQPRQKFLLYKEAEQPADLDNWLLDIQLAEGEFRTDQASVWLSELELPLHPFEDLTAAHPAFFNNSKRREQLKKLLTKDDNTLSLVRLKMMAVCVGADPRLDNVLEQLLAAESTGNNDAMALLQNCGLDKLLWEWLERQYAYTSEAPGLKDFVIALFGWSYFHYFDAVGQHKLPTLNGDAQVFLKRWKDSRAYQSAFEAHSENAATILGIETDLHQRGIRDLLELDEFRLIEQKLISVLVEAVEKRTETAGDITLWCRQRRMSRWYDEYRYLYVAIEVASQFVSLLDTVQLSAVTANEAVGNYTRHWFRLDQLYRQYIHALKVSGQTSLLNALTRQIENLYNNRYLLPLANTWQQHVDAMENWHVDKVVPQHQFFHRWVQPYLKKKNKIYVIISDAFRFEAGEEMVSRIRQEDRYQAELDYQLSSLPSYTQLGMAALLPGAEKPASLTINANKTATVSLGGQSTQGKIYRDKVLKSQLGERAAAVLSKDLQEMTATDSRELLKAHDVIYFYHNRIDHAGDKMQSEGEAFEAVEKTFHDLMLLIKKLVNANATNILMTADHGFIYQNQPLADSDFLDLRMSGENFRDRRFVLGDALPDNSAIKRFTRKQSGLSGEGDILIPKGIQRLRLQGSGSRFVHGGATLQEVITPVIRVNKKRQSDIRLVQVDILGSGSGVITSGQLSVALYQAEPVTDKVQARTLRCGIYTEANQLISDQHEVLFDLMADNPREREMKLRFVLTQAADEANGQQVILRLDEWVSGTTRYQEYRVLHYTLRRSFTTDFDF